MLREEHMDVFGAINATSKTYSAEAAIGAVVAGNVITIDPSVPNYDAKVYMTEAAAGAGDKINLALAASNEIASNGAALVNGVTISNVAFTTANLTKGKVLYKDVLPKGYTYFQFTSTNNGAFSAGKITGTVVPEFN